MDLRYSPDTERFRKKVKAFLDDHLPAGWQGVGALEGAEYEGFVAEWRKTLHANGFLALSWPQEYGGPGLSPLEQVIVYEEFAKRGAPTGNLNDVFSVGMAGNAILSIGTQAQKDYFIPRILGGEIAFCQGFSEPGAGSDLASLRTRAVREEDEFVFNGQKIWTSFAETANWIMLLARTDPDAPKHKGITFFLVPTKQAGIEFRPIKMMSGAVDFCETWITDARTSVGNVLGEVNDGWRVANLILQFERGEAAATLAIKFRADLDRLIELARDSSQLADPAIRRELAWCHSRVEMMKWMGWKSLSSFLKGRMPGPESSIMKVYWSEYLQRYSDLAMRLMGEDGLFAQGRIPMTSYQTDDVGAPNSSASWQSVFLNARAASIYAGTSEIQRNIIAERILGLPRG